jgi:hypothetical protein
LREERRLRVFMNRLLRQMFGPKKYAATRELRKLRNEELNKLYSPKFFSRDKIEKNEMCRACSACGGGEAYTEFWWGNLRERDNLEDPCIDGRIILILNLSKWDEVVWSGSTYLRIGTDGVTCEHGGEPSGSVKCSEFLG